MQYQKYGVEADIISVFGNANEEITILLSGDDPITLKIAEAALLAIELNKAVDEAIISITDDVDRIRKSGGL